MKRFLAIILCLSLALSAAGCASGYAIFKLDTNPEAPSTAQRVEVQSADDYSAVYQALKSVQSTRYISGMGGAVDEDIPLAIEDAEAPMMAADDTGASSNSTPSATPSPSDGGEYSETNVQVKGVDEGDIVKTDGKYIYIIRENKLIIVKAAAGDTVKLSETTVGTEWDYSYTDDESSETSKYPFALYISGTKLVVLSSYYHWESYKDGAGIWQYNDSQRVEIDIYDVSDPKNPTLTHKLGQDGYSIDSRMIDGRLYLLSTYHVYDELDEENPGTFIPCTYRDGESKLIAATDICIMPVINSTSYTIVSVFNVETGHLSSNETVLGGGSTVYMNSENLYLTRNIYDGGEGTPYKEGVYTVTDYSSKSTTEILRFDISGGGVKLASTGSVDGYLESQFSMDEYEGYLRMVTTIDEYSYSIYSDETMGFSNYKWGEDKTSNSLYILDSDLNIVGSIEELAPSERVYSVRFDGDVGYFCTFRQVDPLFTVDLSSPSNPKILSALKIPGFSEYLHVYGDGLLFGFGQDADEETGRTQGLKLSMFDTSDPENVTEKWKLSLDESYSEALYNHKAVLISMGKNIIAFPADGNYVIYSFSEDDGFYKRASVDSSSWGYNLRGLYIGDYVYVLTDSTVTVLDMSDFTAIHQITI